MPGHRHGDRHGQEGPPRLDRRRRRGRASPQGIRDAYREEEPALFAARAALDVRGEATRKTNLPAQIDIYAEGEDAYEFLFVAKGGGSANKTFLYQATPSLLTQDRLLAFLKEKILTLGTAACPPYHLAIVIGGTSAELTLKTVKLASTRYLDSLPTEGSERRRTPSATSPWRTRCTLTQALGVGAQFGGKYFCHDVRVIRLPRHGASLPIGLGVSCSADRQALGKITRDGVFLEELEHDPGALSARDRRGALGGEVVRIDLNRPMPEILATLSRHPIRTRLSLTGPMIVARDLAHAKIRERLERGRADAGLFQEPSGLLCRPGQDAGGLRLRLVRPDHGRAHGQLSSTSSRRRAARWSCSPRATARAQVREACAKHGGFYLGSIGGPAARLAQDCIQQGRGARISRARHGGDLAIEVEDFPAFIVIDDKGNDFFKELNLG